MKQQEALEQISFMRQLVEDTRLIVASGYPFFLLWGVVWIAGYVSQAIFTDEVADRIWTPLIVGAGIGQVVILFVFRGRAGWGSTSLTKKLFRINIVLVVAMLYLPLMLASPSSEVAADILGPGSGPDLRLYFPFWIGVIYAVNGIFLGREMVAIGLWIVGAVTVAQFLPGSGPSWWMAIAGGGSLLLTGVLLRNTYKAALVRG